MDAPPELYRVLQVDPAAERGVIRAAYLCLAKQHHPDAGGAPARMVALNEAWAVLGDPARRAAYDEARRAAPEPPTAPVRSAPDEARAVHAPPRGGTASGSTGTRLDFGRYAGWTLDALAREDPDYLEWLARAPGGRQYRTEITACLAARTSAASRTAPGSAPRRSAGWRLPWQARAWAER